MTGSLTDGDDALSKKLSVSRFSRPRDPWFYLHAEQTASHSNEPTKELVPLNDYCFRYDRGGFWVGRSAFTYMKFPFNRFTRWFLDDFLRTRMMYKALHSSRYGREYVVQDLALPYSTAEEFIQYSDEAFGIYPLWLCPLKQSPVPTLHPHKSSVEAEDKTPEPMLNVGLWGFGPKNRRDFVTLNRHLEGVLKELGGMKWLYARTFYTEDEFWEMFDKSWYDGLREKYHASSLPSVYDKVKPPKEDLDNEQSQSLTSRMLSVWPFAGLWGLLKAIESREYLAARRSTWKSIEEKDLSS